MRLAAFVGAPIREASQSEDTTKAQGTDDGKPRTKRRAAEALERGVALFLVLRLRRNEADATCSAWTAPTCAAAGSSCFAARVLGEG
jgi:hypothetical protein